MRQMDVADRPGRLHAGARRPGGGFKADLTIMRLGDELFRVVTGGAHGPADRKWFSDRLPADGSAQLTDITSGWTTLGLWGPRARDILPALTRDDVSHEGFRFGTCRTIEVDTLRVLASRISYVGDLGWELYVPIEQGARLWDMVWEAGRAARPRPRRASASTAPPAGSRSATAPTASSSRASTTSSRRAWRGAKVKDEDFVGRDAHLRHRDEEPAAILCTLTVDDHTSTSGVKRYMLGREPILDPRRQPPGRPQGPRLLRHERRGRALDRQAHPDGLPAARAGASRASELAVEYLGERYPVTVAVAGADAGLRPREHAGSGRCH